MYPPGRNCTYLRPESHSDCPCFPPHTSSRGGDRSPQMIPNSLGTRGMYQAKLPQPSPSTCLQDKESTSPPRSYLCKTLLDTLYIQRRRHPCIPCRTCMNPVCCYLPAKPRTKDSLDTFLAPTHPLPSSTFLVHSQHRNQRLHPPCSSQVYIASRTVACRLGIPVGKGNFQTQPSGLASPRKLGRRYIGSSQSGPDKCCLGRRGMSRCP